MPLASMALPIDMPRNDQRKKRPNIVQAAKLTGGSGSSEIASRQRAPSQAARAAEPRAPRITATRKRAKQA